jgi:hypothetical protein
MSRITATLSVVSDRIRPDQITSLLSFTPDHSVLKGDDRTPPRSVPKSYGWYVTSRSEVDATADGVLSSLLKRVGAVYDRIASLLEEDPDIRVTFHVAIVPYSENVSLYFRAETITCVSKFGGALDIEFFDE